jgi:hypothetical protein
MKVGTTNVKTGQDIFQCNKFIFVLTPDYLYAAQCESECLLQTFVALAAVVAAWLIFSLVIESSGFFTPGNPVSYEKNPAMKVNGVSC